MNVTQQATVRDVFILVPSLRRTGPVRGAVALANALASERQVTLVALKSDPGIDDEVSPRVRLIRLGEHRSWPGRARAYRRLLEENGGRARAASISFCLSADVINRLCGSAAFTCASVRGNLPINYRLDYGASGVPLARGHLAWLRGFDAVVAMTRAMAEQIRRYARREPALIRNFVDEPDLSRYRASSMPAGPLRFVYLASLTNRKQPLAVVEAFAALSRAGVDCRLEMIGGGPLRSDVERLARELAVADRIRLHGELEQPYGFLGASDAMVLPSLAEGVSRAALEALHLGVPCVLRDVDGNAELIQPGVNGALFRDTSELVDAMRKTAVWSRSRIRRESLLPPEFRQGYAAHQYLELVERTA